MLRTRLTGFAIAMLALALLAATSGAASAKAKRAKLTYDQAWEHCTKELDRNHILRADSGQRYAAGGACMLRYGYRI